MDFLAVAAVFIIVVVLEMLGLLLAAVGAGELDDRRYQDHRFLSLALFPMP